MASNNPLNQYDLSTYHFKLYITNPVDGYTRNLLAESANSPYFIDNVVITSVISPTQKYGTTLAITINFKIHEPNGAYFFDWLVERGNEINVDNYLKTVFILELSFVGENGCNITPGATDEVEWKLVMTNVDAKVSSSGTEYSFSAVPENEYVTSNQVSMIEEPVNLEANNIHDYFSELSGELAKIKKHHATAHESDAKIDKFTFNISDEVVGDGKFIPQKTQEEQSSANDAPYDDQIWSRQLVNTAENIAIQDLLDIAIGNTEHFQKNLKKSAAADSNEKHEFKPKDFYLIVPHVKGNPQFDAGKQNYVRSIEYEVRPYKKGNTKTTKAEDESEGFVGEVIKNYEYLFTGKNVDVMDLDINFQFNTFTPVPKQGGVTNNPTSSYVGAKLKQEEKEENLQRNVEQIQQQHATNEDGRGGSTIGKIPESFNVDPSEGLYGYGLYGQRHEGRTTASTYFLQSLDTFAHNMLAIDLKVRGDPDWLVYGANNGTIPSSDVYFTLKVRSPDNEMLETCTFPSTNSLIVSGYYRVIEIESNFEGGMFTQTIHAVRNVDKVLE